MFEGWRKRRDDDADHRVLESLRLDGAGGRWLIGHRARLRAARLEPALHRLETAGLIESYVAENGFRIWRRPGQLYP